jgi:RNA polymerase sigma-70 factor (ECF subfamily)
MNQTDTIHIQNILKGNKNSEQHIYFKYKKLIKKLIHVKYDRYNQSDDNIDDYVADIMVSIFVNLSKFDDKKSDFSTWVYNIANNYMKNVIKSNCTRKANSEDRYVNCTSTNASIAYETNNTLDFLSKQISNEDFIMLSMKYMDGYNYNEIGKEFNTTSTRISNKINYIKTRLRANKHLIYD